MKTKKRKVGIIVAIVFIVVVLLGALLFDFFYGNNQDKWVAKEVSTAAELQKGGTNIKLTNDISAARFLKRLKLIILTAEGTLFQMQ